MFLIWFKAENKISLNKKDPELFRIFFVLWRVGELNPWPTDCQPVALANWANPPANIFVVKYKNFLMICQVFFVKFLLEWYIIYIIIYKHFFKIFLAKDSEFSYYTICSLKVVCYLPKPLTGGVCGFDGVGRVMRRHADNHSWHR